MQPSSPCPIPDRSYPTLNPTLNRIHATPAGLGYARSGSGFSGSTMRSCWRCGGGGVAGIVAAVVVGTASGDDAAAAVAGRVVDVDGGEGGDMVVAVDGDGGRVAAGEEGSCSSCWEGSGRLVAPVVCGEVG